MLLEHLETRLAPAAFIWSGADAVATGNHGLSDAKNWQGGVAPLFQSGGPSLDDLVFPSGLSGQALTIQNNYGNNANHPAFNSITIAGSGYTLSGNALILGDPSLYNSGYVNVASGSVGNDIKLSLIINGASAVTGSVQVFTINNSAILQIDGAMSGNTGSQLTKEGGGELILNADNSGFNGPFFIDQNAGIVEILQQNALGTGVVTVAQNSTLQLNTGGGVINNSLILNGPGANSAGALFNLVGNNTWNGPITMDSDSTIGGPTGTLTINGQISDTGSGHNLTKEGLSELVLAPPVAGNAYRGTTTINGGILQIQNPLALGSGDGSVNTAVTVNQSITESGTLQLAGAGYVGGGYSVDNKLLILNGHGVGGGVGALDNASGNNLWHGNVILGSPAPNGSPVFISAQTSPTSELPQSLTIGVYFGIIGGPNNQLETIQDPNSSVYVISGTEPLTKIGLGTVDFTSDNTYSGGTTIAAGTLEIQDSNALGKSNGTVNVDNNATLELAKDPNSDNIPDSTTHTVNKLMVSNTLNIFGTGSFGVGALFSHTGINSYAGTITLLGNGFSNQQDAIGVDPDPNPHADRTYLTLDYQLDITGHIQGGVNNVLNIPTNSMLVKLGNGMLVLTNANTNFYGQTDIQAGWITIEANNSLGGQLGDVGDTTQPPTTVEYGSALMLEPPAGGALSVPNNLILYGTGITQNVNETGNSSLYTELTGVPNPVTGISSGEGALLSLDGQNIIKGNVELGGGAGVGSQSIDAGYVTPGELTFNGPISQVNPVISVNVKSPGNASEVDIPINVGSDSGTININPDTFVVADDLRVYLGGNATTGTLIYDSSNTPYPGPNSPTSTGSAGNPNNPPEIQITYTATSATLTVAPTNPAWNPNLADGAKVINFSPLTSQTIEIVMNQSVNGQGNTLQSDEWAVQASVEPTPPPVPSLPATLIKLGSQDVTLQGANTYQGGVNIQEGVLTAQNSQALGTPAAGYGVTIGNGTSLLLASIDASDLATTPFLNGGLPSGLAIYGTSLTINGTGNDTLLPVTTAPYPDPQTLTPVAQDPLVNVKGDNLWHDGPISLDNTVVNGVVTNSNFNLDVRPNSRLNLGGSIVDEITTPTTPTSITMDDTGELILSGSNTYHGITYVNKGILAVENNAALGSTDGKADTGVQVAYGAQLQLVGSVTIANKVLTLQGSGTSAANTPVVPDSWANEGPAPLNNGDVPNPTINPVSGRVTGVASDPNDPNVIYVAAAGGGVWKTENGLSANPTWTPLFDNVLNPDGTHASMFIGAVAVDPANPQIIIVGTGEADNSTDSFYGTGVYESTNSGRTWNLVTSVPGGSGQNPFYGMAISSIAIDQHDPDSTVAQPVFYVASSDVNVTNDPNAGVGGIVDNPGIWRYDPKAGNHGGTVWFNMTDVVSVIRTPVPTAPGTPGPDDDFLMRFPQGGQDLSAWTDLKIVNGILFAAQGAAFGYPFLPVPYPPIGLTIPPSGLPTDAVFRCPVGQEFYYSGVNNNGLFYPYSGNYEYANTVWFVGEGYISDNPNSNYGLVINATDGGQKPFPTPLGNTPAFTPSDGVIKVAPAPNVAIIAGNGQLTGTVAAVVTYPTTAENSQPTTDLEGSFFTYDTSTNGGMDWGASTPVSIAQFQGTQGHYDSAIAAASPGQIYFGGEGTAIGQQTVIEAAKGAILDADVSLDSAGNGPGKNVHTMYYVPTTTDPTGKVIDAHILVGTDEGLWSIDVQNDADTWTDLNGNLATELVSSGGVSTPLNSSSTTFIATQGSGTDVSSGAQNWSMVDDNFGANLFGGKVAVDPSNPQIVYDVISNAQMEQEGEVFPDGPPSPGVPNTGNFPTTYLLRKSTDGGIIWNTIYQSTNTFDLLQNPGMVLDQVDPSRLLISDYQTIGNQLFGKLMQSTDGGNSFINLYNSATAPRTVPTAIAVAEYQGQFVFDPRFSLVTDLGTNTYDPSTIYTTDGSNLYLTKNMGVSWANATPDVATFQGNIAAIEVDPRNRDDVYVVCNGPIGQGAGRVFYSTQAGIAGSWTDITGNLPDLPTWSVVVDPRNSNVYIGNDHGVWQLTSPTANTWVSLGAGGGMPQVQVTTLDLNQNLNTLTVGTFGRSVFTYNLDDAVANSGAMREVSGTSIWAGPIVLAGPTTFTAAGNQALQNGVTAATLDVQGPISDAAGTSNNTITIGIPGGQANAGGNVVFAGTNSYTGQTIVTAGVLVADNPSSLSPNSTLGALVNLGTALELESNLFHTPITLNGDGYAYNGHFTGSLRNISNNNTYTGPLTLATNATIGVDSGTSLTIGYSSVPNSGTGSISDGGKGFNVTKEGTGTLILNSANSYGGTTIIDEGAIDVENALAL